MNFSSSCFLCQISVNWTALPCRDSPSCTSCRYHWKGLLKVTSRQLLVSKIFNARTLFHFYSLSDSQDENVQEQVEAYPISVVIKAFEAYIKRCSVDDPLWELLPSSIDPSIFQVLLKAEQVARKNSQCVLYKTGLMLPPFRRSSLTSRTLNSRIIRTVQLISCRYWSRPSTPQ